MPDPLKIYVVPRKTVNALMGDTPVSQSFLDGYLQCRPGILDDGHCDIFEENCRSEDQKWKDFSLFQRVTAPQADTVVVFPFWLELFEADNKSHLVKKCIDWLAAAYPKNPIVVQWNHDKDAAKVPELQSLPENFFVLQFNTSRRTPNDIILPFWTINTEPDVRSSYPKYIAGFVGYGGTELRRMLRNQLSGRADVLWSEDRVSEFAYFKLMASCFFSLCPRGGGLGSYRLYESIQCERPPIIFGTDAVLPFTDILYWADFSLSFNERTAATFGNAQIEYLHSLTKRVIGSHCYWEQAIRRLRQIRPLFSLLGVQQEIYRRLWEWFGVTIPKHNIPRDNGGH